ncbi:MAG: transcriptional regulator GcvA [Proteobacteria bacterium]|nr:transcriptional regulator GcvA [Pseudomonadota bacterium]MBI3497809.1 transcriptional regulator GcvA [Pseudomonadota bacterium]
MNQRLPPLNALKAFEAAGRHLSFTKAAEELGVTQAAISHQIKFLEELLGQKLFRRMTRRLMLTDAGQTLLPGIRDGFETLSAAVARLRASGSSGSLTVSLMATLALRWLVPRLARWQQAHPDIDVRLSTTARLVDFQREDVDVAIRHGWGAWPGLRCDKLFAPLYTPLLNPALLPPGVRLTRPADLFRLPLLREHDEEVNWRAWFAAAGETYAPIQRGPEFDSTVMAGQAAIQGLGAALAPPEFFAEELSEGRLIQPFSIMTSAGKAYYLVCPEARGEQPKIQAFRQWLMDEVAADAANSNGRARTAA